jgi:hypothetical protein
VRLSARKFNYNILGNLPAEFVHNIAGYLKDVDIISSRRVSQRWQEVLSSEELCGKACFSEQLHYISASSEGYDLAFLSIAKILQKELPGPRQALV